MALTKKNAYDTKSVFLKIKSKDANLKNVPPYFSLTEKVGDDWVTREDTVDSLTGTLFKVAPKQREYNGDIIKGAALYFRDNDEVYILDLTFNMISRGILNAVLGIQDFSQPVEISLYESKKGFPSASVRVNGQRADWKFALDALPQPEVTSFKGKELKDYSKLDAFFFEEVSNLGAKLGEQHTDKPSSKQPTVRDIPPHDPDLDETDDEDGKIPF